MGLDGKSFVLTGGTSGIGAAISRKIVEQGGMVLLMGRDRDRLEAACRKLGPDLATWECADFLNEIDFSFLAKQIKERLGQVYGFVHVAGIERTRPFRNLSFRDFDEVMRVNFLSCAGLLRAMLANRGFEAKQGSIVLIGSVMSVLGQASKSAYCASKGAMIPFAKCLALELARKGIRVNTVLPGLVKTEMSEELFRTLDREAKDSIERMHPLGFGDVEDVADAVAFLLSPRAKWITGTELVVDGGFSCH